MDIEWWPSDDPYIIGDCLPGMKQLPDNCIDTFITDPPYGLKFMGKKWDYDIPSIEIFEEMLRIAKPGSTLLCFGGTRTYHRMACNIEDAGWIIKDCIMWLYGSGFPKASDVSKQIDKMNAKTIEYITILKNELRKVFDESGLTLKELNEKCGFEASGYLRQSSTWKYILPTIEKWQIMKSSIGTDKDFSNEFKEAEREVIGKKEKLESWQYKGNNVYCSGDKDKVEIDITAPATDESKLWEGWKSHSLKPAYEPIIVAMKPNEGTYAQNALKYGVSGLWIDGSRIPLSGEPNPSGSAKRIYKSNQYTDDKNYGGNKTTPDEGRFPANVILDEEAGRLLDKQSGERSAGKSNNDAKVGESGKTTPLRRGRLIPRNDTGGASRFFKVCSHSNSERKPFGGLTTGVFKGEGTIRQEYDEKGGPSRFFYCSKANAEREEGNIHPTVKPVELIKYLCKLTRTPIGGIVLDPFLGSGTTLLACMLTNRIGLGFEINPDDEAKIRKRIKADMNLDKWM